MDNLEIEMNESIQKAQQRVNRISLTIIANENRIATISKSKKYDWLQRKIKIAALQKLNDIHKKNIVRLNDHINAVQRQKNQLESIKKMEELFKVHK